MGYESVLKIGGKVLKQVAKKAYVKPEVRTMKSIGLKTQEMTDCITKNIETREKVIAMSLSDEKKALGVMRKFSIENKDKMLQRLRTSTQPISQIDKSMLQSYVSTLKAKGFPKEVLEELNNAKTIGEMQAAIINFKYKLQIMYKPVDKYIPHIKPGSIPLEVEQMFYEITNKCNEARRNLYLLCSRNSTGGLAKDIEDLLRKNYNINAYLGNDTAKATQIYDAVSCAAEKGCQLPNEIIVTHYIQGGEHLALGNGTRHTMLIGSTAIDDFAKKCPKATLTDSAKQLMKDWRSKTGFKAWNSTDISAHVPLHEIMHQDHLPLLAFKSKPIPKKYNSTIKHLSGYAASKPAAAHEVYTELNTKRLVSKLTPDEMSLFEFLGGKV